MPFLKDMLVPWRVITRIFCLFGDLFFGPGLFLKLQPWTYWWSQTRQGGESWKGRQNDGDDIENAREGDDDDDDGGDDDDDDGDDGDDDGDDDDK